MDPAERRKMREQMMEERQQLQDEINEATEEIVRQFERRLRRQVEVARDLTRISPVAAYVYACTDLGGTGVRYERRLIAEIRAYQRQFVRYVEEKIGEDSTVSWWGGTDENYSIDDMPVFTYRTEPLEERMAARGTDILLLVLFGVIFFLLSFLSFLRTDIT